MPPTKRIDCYQFAASVMATMVTVLIAMACCESNAFAQASASGQRGPGLKPFDATTLELPVPRTAQLTHVQPQHFAKALGNDPQRIFAFMRDHIAYEAYHGSLRGPRGTLLALSGNSVDRAALAAAMLEAAGRKTRFARGQLSEKDATELVDSMWIRWPQPQTDEKAKTASDELQTSARQFAAAIERDYFLIRELLEKTPNLPPPDAAPSLQALIDQARSHVWVQFQDQGKWLDFDPLFADAKPGKVHATVEETFAGLAPKGQHRLAIRMQIEEFPLLENGDVEIKPQVREVLRFESPAAEISGFTAMLAHQPEKWKGPADSVAAAISTAIEETGRVKPVLLLNDQEPKWQAGKPFQQRLRTGGGIGRVGSLLGGAGTRKPVPVTTAAWLEVDLLAPNGDKQSIRRDLFDVIGLARRAESRPFRSSEIRELTGSETNSNVTTHLYSLFFTTGRIHSVHFRDAVIPQETDQRLGSNVIAAVTQMHLTFAATSDDILSHVTARDGTAVRCYCTTPRLHIVEAARDSKTVYMGFDLRHDRATAITREDRPQVIQRAQLMRGIVNGTLECVVLEHFLASTTTKSDRVAVISTSSLFESARRDNIPVTLLKRDSPPPEVETSGEFRWRLKKDLDAGYLAVAPAQAIQFHDAPSYAWWRIDPRTGESLGVTEDGLHGTTATEKPTIESVLKIIYIRALNIYLVEFVIGETGLAGTVYCVISRIDPPEDFVNALSLMAQNVIRTSIP